jgi:putative endonuclease
MYYTYIIFSISADQYFTGHTLYSPTSRLDQHNRGETPSMKHAIPWKLKFYKSFKTKTEAIKFENFIKRQKSRHFIEKLIKSDENEFQE